VIKPDAVQAGKVDEILADVSLKELFILLLLRYLVCYGSNFHIFMDTLIPQQQQQKVRKISPTDNCTINVELCSKNM